MSGTTERIANARNMLTLASELKTDYSNLVVSQATTTDIQGNLTGQVQSLMAKKKDLDTGISTFEQDFLEKRGTLGTPRKNFQTLQDMVLAIFFISYLMISLVVCTYVSRITNSILFFLAAAFVMLALGVVISQIIIRFA